MLGATLFLPQWCNTVKHLTELDIYILKQEFPGLSLTEDPDIERYFEFRALNRQAEALKLYNTRLIHRYPDARMRVLLMTYYRKHDVRFQVLLTDSLAQLAGKTITQVKKVIIFFAKTITPLKDAKVYTVIRVCEKVISAISSDRFAAISFTEKYVRYAARLNYYEKDMRQAADTLRMYITDTISSVREFREERARDAQEQSRRAAKKQQAAGIDFSKIHFTKEQTASITIARSISRIEDQVLAYTVKYWNRFDDGAFENILLLYSRKYGTNHFSIFQAVKTGRIRKWKDEELLHAVLANVAHGYYYSISGDLYLQRTWKQLKLKLGIGVDQHSTSAKHRVKDAKQEKVPQEKAILRGKSIQQAVQTKPEQKASSVVPKRGKPETGAQSAEKNTAQKPQKVTAPKTARQTTQPKAMPASATQQSSASRVAPAAKPHPKKAAGTKSRTLTTAPALPLQKEQQPTAPSPIPAQGKDAMLRQQNSSRSEPVQSSKTPPVPEAKQPIAPQIYPLNEPKEAPLSIADTVKKVTGKSYGIYRELFFKEVRSAIRAILQYCAVQKLSFFGTEQNHAENIIYDFLETNYDNPYQQWQGSQAQADVLAQGFRIDSLELIIRRWAKDNI